MSYLKFFCTINPESPDGLLECETVSIQAASDELRVVARFLFECAERMDAAPDVGPMLHFHLQDEWEAWSREYPDLIAAAPPKDD